MSVSLGQALHPQVRGLTAEKLVRAELGAGSDRLQVFAVAQLGQADATAWYDAAEFGDAILTGDVLISDLGAGVRMPWRHKLLRVTPHLDLGIVRFDTPLTHAVYEDELVAEAGREFAVPPHTTGVWGAAGCEVGVALPDSPVVAFVAADLGYVTVSHIGVSVGARLGFETEF